VKMIDITSTHTKYSPAVAIVILNWNGAADTLACLRSVEKIDYSNFMIIVIDNGSSDDSVAVIRAAFPKIEVIETGSNLGFAGGNNVGIKRALELDADHVLLLNNDTEVDSGILNAFVDAARRFPRAGVFSGKIYFHDDPKRIWYAGVQWNIKEARFRQLGEGMQDDGASYSAICETDYACGCAFFVPAKRLREIGLLDEDFFLYFEETDWSYRARKAGYPSIFVPGAILWHKVSVSFGGEDSPLALYFVTRNRLLWARKHAAWRRRLDTHAKAWRSLFQRFIGPLAGTHLRGAFTLKAWWWSVHQAFRDPRNLAYFMGVRDFCLGRFGDCPPAVRELARHLQSQAVESTHGVAGPG
jgi:GT2 family glycosyltransferase